MRIFLSNSICYAKVQLGLQAGINFRLWAKCVYSTECSDLILPSNNNNIALVIIYTFHNALYRSFVTSTTRLTSMLFGFAGRVLFAFFVEQFQRRLVRSRRDRPRRRYGATEVLNSAAGACRGREVTVRREQRRVMLYRLEVTVPVRDLQLGRQLFFPLGPPVLKPRLDLYLGQVQGLGQFHALAHAQIFVRLQQRREMLKCHYTYTLREIIY